MSRAKDGERPLIDQEVAGNRAVSSHLDRVGSALGWGGSRDMEPGS